VSLCLDTGHLAYGRADSVAIIQNFPSRIGYVHIKQMDPAIVAKAEAEDLPFGQAVAMGASVEPPGGLPDIGSVLAALEELDAELFTVVEQDMYPCDFGQPQPIAQRTFNYLTSHGREGTR
jgi:inosose dehydratase